MKETWIKTIADYVVDLVEYDPEIEEYVSVEVEFFPADVCCGCYQLIDGEFVLDEEKRLSQIENKEPENYNQVLAFARMTINDTPLTDMQALSVKDLYPEWGSFIGQSLPASTRVQHEHRLYNVRQDIAIVLEHQPPSIDTASLYEEINEQHTGTLDDPIPYNGNMALENGKYYIQFDVIYKCIRDTGNPVYHDLSALVGMYVEVVQ